MSAGASRHGAGVLLLHGLGGCAYQLEGVARSIPGSLAPNAIYHGGRGAHGDLTFVAAARDALAHLDRAGLGRVVVAGVSMGAATALTIASLEPARVAGLVLISPAWLDTPFPPNLERLRKVGRRLVDRGLDHTWQLLRGVPPLDGWEPTHVEAYRRRFLAYDPVATGRAMQELPGELPLLRHRAIDSVDGPRVVLTWTDDPIHPVPLATAVAGVAGAPDAVVVPRPRRYDHEQALLAAIVCQFMDRDELDLRAFTSCSTDPTLGSPRAG